MVSENIHRFYRHNLVIRLKNGKPLTPDLGFESHFDAKTGQITLKHKAATNKQTGELICRVENTAGTIDAPVTLDVQGNTLHLFNLSIETSSSLFSFTDYHQEINRSRNNDRQ